MDNGIKIGDLVYDGETIGMIVEILPISTGATGFMVHDYVIEWYAKKHPGRSISANCLLLKKWRENAIVLKNEK